MAPQAFQVAPASTHTPANPAPKPWVPIPVAFSIFIGICLAYVLSYLLYRFVMSRRRQSEADSPDYSVSQFMNGARLTLNLGQPPKSPSSLSPDEPPHVPDEEKALADPTHPAASQVPAISPPGSSPPPFIILTPLLSEEDLGEVLLRERAQDPEPTISMPARAKTLSKDRVEAIALDPKLAPVQGPLRPLSMSPSPTRKKRTLFGLGLTRSRVRSGKPETDVEAR